jgi:peptidoglycan biosynthesis protein MviN/MurJ (putative lipid II flippase)
LAVSAEVLTLLFVLRRRLGGVEGWQTLDSLGRVLVATLVMGLIIIGVLALGQRAGAGALWMVAVGGVAGVLGYIGVGLLLGVQALRRLPAALLTGQLRSP